MEKHSPLPDRNQNFWHLTSIQSASQSIPGMLIGGVLAQKYGASIAFTSICIGNLVLWLIGLGVISMAYGTKSNAVENVKGYLGKGAGLLMAIILITAFLSWYMFQVQTAIEAISPLFSSDQKWKLSVLGVTLGILTAFLAMGGIRWIKWICIAGFPFLLLFVLYAIIASDYSMKISWELSFPAILTVIAITLPGTVNLPTFFRHSHSRADSLLALILMTVFAVVFQVCSIFTAMTEPSELLTKYNLSTENIFRLTALISFIFVSLNCINLVNIYFASASLEALIPRWAGPKVYVVIGLLGTAAYAFLQRSSLILFLENMTDNFIASLGLVLLASFLVKMIVKHRPRTFEKLISGACWATGCVTAVIVQIYHPQDPNVALLAGISASVIAFLCIAFFEESIWAMKKLSLERKNH